MLDAVQNYRVAWRIYGKVGREAAEQAHEGAAVREGVTEYGRRIVTEYPINQNC